LENGPKAIPPIKSEKIYTQQEFSLFFFDVLKALLIERLGSTEKKGDFKSVVEHY
jgi:hypothetical protein